MPNFRIGRNGRPEEYRLDEAGLAEFLAQPMPREVPHDFKHLVRTSDADIAGVAVALGGIVFIPMIGGPLFLWDRLGIWAVVLSAIGFAVSATVVTLIVKWARGRPTLAEHGVFVMGRFAAVKFTKSTGEVSAHWTGRLQFEVDGQTHTTGRQLPSSHADYAAWLYKENAEIPILYSRQSPQNCMWAGEFLNPSPDPPPIQFDK